MSGLKTMLRNAGNPGDPEKTKKNVRFVNPESVSSGYASSEIDHLPLSPQQMLQNQPNGVFQYPTGLPTPPVPRQLNFQPPHLASFPSSPVTQSSMPMSPTPAMPYIPFASLPTIAEHTPPPMMLPHHGNFTTPYDPEMAHRWSKWTQLVEVNWPYLAQLDETARFQKICELAVVATTL